MGSRSPYSIIYANGKAATNQVLIWLREQAGLEDPRDAGNSPVRAWVPWTRIAISKPDAVVPETILSSLENAIKCREETMQYHDPDTNENSQHAFALEQLRFVRSLLSTLPREPSLALPPQSQANLAVRNRWESLPVDVPDLGWSSGGSNTSRDSSMDPCAYGEVVASKCGKRKRQNRPRSGHHEPAHQRQKSSLSNVLDFPQQIEDSDQVGTKAFVASPTHEHVRPAAGYVRDLSVRVDHTVIRNLERKQAVGVKSAETIPTCPSATAANKIMASAIPTQMGTPPEFIPGAKFHVPATSSSFTTTDTVTNTATNMIFSGHNSVTTSTNTTTTNTTTANTTTTEYTPSPARFNDFEVKMYGGPPWGIYDDAQPLDSQAVSDYPSELAETFFNQWDYTPN